MKILGNPFITEDLSSSYTDARALRSYLAFIVIMAVVMMVWWPRNPFTSYLRTGIGPDSFIAAALGLLGCMTYFGSRFGAEGFSEESGSKVHDFVKLTPVPVSSVVAGKLAASVLHTLFLLALGLPFLLLGSTVNGAPLTVIAKAAAVAGSSALAFRAFAFLCFTMFEPSKILKDGITLFCGLAFLIATTSVIQPLSPISAVLSLDKPAAASVLGRPVPYYLISIIMSSLAAALFYFLSGIWLRILRRRHAREPPVVSAAQSRAERLLKGLWDDGTDGSGGSG